MNGVVHVLWDPPATGAAPAGYTVSVTGSFAGSATVLTRTIAAPAPPGAYGISIAAVNACGSSLFTVPQTVFVQ